MNRLSKVHFWTWFARNCKEYVQIHTRPKKEHTYWLNELKSHLRAYYKFFDFTLALSTKEPSILVITVKGKAVHFKKVDALVARAPEIAGWKVAALEDPYPIDFQLEDLIKETCTDPREFFFSFAGDYEGRRGIYAYHPLCTDYNCDSLGRLANAAIYNLLGERSYGNDVLLLDVINLSLADPQKLQRLEELPDCIGSTNSTLTIDANGRLLGE